MPPSGAWPRPVLVSSSCCYSSPGVPRSPTRFMAGGPHRTPACLLLLQWRVCAVLRPNPRFSRGAAIAAINAAPLLSHVGEVVVVAASVRCSRRPAARPSSESLRRWARSPRWSWVPRRCCCRGLAVPGRGSASPVVAAAVVATSPAAAAAVEAAAAVAPAVAAAAAAAAAVAPAAAPARAATLAEKLEL